MVPFKLWRGTLRCRAHRPAPVLFAAIADQELGEVTHGGQGGFDDPEGVGTWCASGGPLRAASRYSLKPAAAGRSGPGMTWMRRCRRPAASRSPWSVGSARCRPVK